MKKTGLGVVIKLTNYDTLLLALRKLKLPRRDVIILSNKKFYYPTDERLFPIRVLSSIKNKIWFHPQHLEVYKKAFSEYEFDESAMKNTANLFSRCKEHNWDRVLLTQDRAILDRFDHLNQLVNLF